MAGLSVREHDERQKELRNILKELKVEWRDGGECIRTCLAIERIFKKYEEKTYNKQQDFIGKINELFIEGIEEGILTKNDA